MQHLLKLSLILLLSLFVACAQNRHIIITSQRLHGYKYVYPKGITIEDFEYEYNEENKNKQALLEYFIENGITRKIGGNFHTDTVQKYDAFYFWRKRNVLYNQQCGCQSKKEVRQYIRTFFKTHAYNAAMKDALIKDVNYNGDSDIKRRILSINNQKIDTFYMGVLYFPETYHHQYYIIHKKRCRVIKNPDYFIRRITGDTDYSRRDKWKFWKKTDDEWEIEG